MCVCARRDLKTSSCKMRACSSPICMCGSSASVHTYIMCAHISSSYGNTGNLGGPTTTSPRKQCLFIFVINYLFARCFLPVIYTSSYQSTVSALPFLPGKSPRRSRGVRYTDCSLRGVVGPREYIAFLCSRTKGGGEGGRGRGL